MSYRLRIACILIVMMGVASFAVASLQVRSNDSNELITNAGWECVQGVTVADGKVVVKGVATFP